MIGRKNVEGQGDGRTKTREKLRKEKSESFHGRGGKEVKTNPCGKTAAGESTPSIIWRGRVSPAPPELRGGEVTLSVSKKRTRHKGV